MLPAASLMMAEGVISSLDDLKKPFVTVINSYTNQIPGHAHLDKIGAIVRDELKALGFNVWYANVGGAVCDGIAMGHFGMKYSLASRELIADQIETIIGAHPCDAWIGIANCDKIVPAMYNAMARINIPAVYLSGGPMLAGPGNTDLITVFEGVGKHSVGKMTDGELRSLAEKACPGCGSCAGMFTANSMNCLGEAIGLALPGNGTIPAERWVDRHLRTDRAQSRAHRAHQAGGARAQALPGQKHPAAGHHHRAGADQRLCARHGDGRLDQHHSAHAGAGPLGAAFRSTWQRLNEISARTPNICKVSPSRPEVHIEDVHRAAAFRRF